MFRVFRAEFSEHLERAGAAPWPAGGGHGVPPHQVTPSTHVCYLSDLIGGTICWTLRSSDSLLLMRPRAAPKLVWEAGWRRAPTHLEKHPQGRKDVLF